ncbi:MAG: D-cysteine desulfhydrase family protein [Clostridia bacterium]|nr:D-cysteine desulfhydrase family protein [Clostridia bacterium]
MQGPNKLDLAHLPTPVQKLEKLSTRLREINANSPEIHIKRDDFSGMEVSGNKIRKLEYSLLEAKNQGCDLLITCGGIQSNHCRATAAIGARMGLKVVLLLMGKACDAPVGNHFMDGFFGATVHMIPSDEAIASLEDLFPKYASLYEEKGYKPYLIPTGASNGIGAFGYKNCMKEIMDNGGKAYDAIVVTVGSAGTYAGLLLGKEAYGFEGDVYGINIAADHDYFFNRTKAVIEESNIYMAQPVSIPDQWIKIIDGYQGDGYALNRPEDFAFIKEIGAMEGLLVDPVYTGKALKGLVAECEKGTFDHCERVLFIHTGGLYGLLAKSGEMASYL